MILHRVHLKHLRAQHPVGQGGFHVGHLGAGQEFQFNYVYDCGSNNLSRLDEEIQSYVRKINFLDVLFLSHLDHDHVSGVEQLMGSVECDAVVLPYLSPLERIELLAEASFRGGVTVSTSELLLNPTAWLAHRGAKRIRYVVSPGDEGQFSPESPSGQGGDEDLVGIRPHLPGEAMPRELVEDVGGGCKDVKVIRGGQSVCLGVRGRVLWDLVPFVNPDEKRAARLRVVVVRAFKELKAASDLDCLKRTVELLRKRGNREKLAQLYTKVFKDRNRSSMALYSGPRVASVNEPRGIAWMGLGDMPLQQKRRRDRFQRFFKHVLPQVSTFLLPHHGSDANYWPGMIPGSPEITWVAAYGANGYGHPGARVVATAARREVDFRRVDDAPHSYFCERACACGSLHLKRSGFEPHMRVRVFRSPHQVTCF